MRGRKRRRMKIRKERAARSRMASRRQGTGEDFDGVWRGDKPEALGKREIPLNGCKNDNGVTKIIGRFHETRLAEGVTCTFAWRKFLCPSPPLPFAPASSAAPPLP